MDPVFLPSYFTPVIVESTPTVNGTNNNNVDFSKAFKQSHPRNSSTMFEPYYPNSNSISFSNQSTITTTAIATNVNSSVSDSNKVSAISLYSFLESLPAQKNVTDFDLAPSSTLFPVSFIEDDHDKQKKSFILHEFNNNINSDLHMDDGQIDTLMDMDLKDDFFAKKLQDEDDNFCSHVKATNMLYSALLDIMDNIHSLNYRIYNHKYVISY